MCDLLAEDDMMASFVYYNLLKFDEVIFQITIFFIFFYDVNLCMSEFTLFLLFEE